MSNAVVTIGRSYSLKARDRGSTRRLLVAFVKGRPRLSKGDQRVLPVNRAMAPACATFWLKVADPGSVLLTHHVTQNIPEDLEVALRDSGETAIDMVELPLR